MQPRDDARQALRMHRSMMAAGTSLMVIALLGVAYVLGGLEWTGLVHGSALILFWVTLFYAVLRSGLDLKLRDPSFTMAQVTSSILTMAYIMYYADRGRGVLLVVLLVAFLFGVFRLRTRAVAPTRVHDSSGVRRHGQQLVSVQAAHRRCRRRNPKVDCHGSR